MKLLLPTYNYVDGPKKIIQENNNLFDITIVDNSENDEIKKITKNKKKIKYIKNKKYLGPIENMNFGLSKIKSGSVTIIHDDELITKKVLFKINKLKLNTKNIYIHNFDVIKNKTLINSNLNNDLRKYLLLKFPKLILFINIIGPTASIIFTNNSDYKFDKKLKFLFDVDFYYQLLVDNSIQFTDLKINSIFKKDTVTSRTKNRKLIEFIDLLYLKKKYKISHIKFVFYVLFACILRIGFTSQKKCL